MVSSPLQAPADLQLVPVDGAHGGPQEGPRVVVHQPRRQHAHELAAVRGNEALLLLFCLQALFTSVL
jgi:hypothetical protein